MASYIQSPNCMPRRKEPGNVGRAVYRLRSHRADDIRLLRDKTVNEQNILIELAQGIQQLTKLLKEEATGYSLEPLYQKVPELLRGYVELYYDLQHHPSFRFYEAMLYAQSLLPALNAKRAADDSGHRRSRVYPEHAETPDRGRDQH